MTQRIAIIGAGALGGYVGGYMTRDGHDPLLIDPWRAHVERMRGDGLELRGLTEPENFTVKCRAVHTGELPDPAATKFDIVVIATKSYDTEWAAKTMLPYLADDGFVVSLQNGINEPAIAAVVGPERTTGCIASMISVELMAPGLIQRNVKLGGSVHTVFRAGELDGTETPRIRAVADMLSSVDSAKVTDDLMMERWSKLAVNCMRNPVGAATGRGTNANDADPATRRLAIRLAAEAAAVGMAEVGRLEKISGILPEQLLAAGAGDADALAAAEQILIDAMARRSDNQRPSMAQDVAKGRPTEIDYINGLVADRATRHGIQVPANAGIVRVIKGIEAGAVDPSPAAVAGL